MLYVFEIRSSKLKCRDSIKYKKTIPNSTLYNIRDTSRFTTSALQILRDTLWPYDTEKNDTTVDSIHDVFANVFFNTK